MKPSPRPPRSTSIGVAAVAVVKRQTTRLPPPVWLHVLLDDVPDVVRDLTDSEERRLDVLGTAVRVMRDTDPEYLLTTLRQNFPDLAPKLDRCRLLLLADFSLTEHKDTDLWPNPNQLQVQPPELEFIFCEDADFEAALTAEAKERGIDAALSKTVDELLKLTGSRLETRCGAICLFLHKLHNLGRMGHSMAPGGPSDPGSEFQGCARLLFERLRSHMPADRQGERFEALSWALMHFALLGYEGNPSDLPESERRQLRMMGTLGLARLRAEISALPAGAASSATAVFEKHIFRFQLCGRTLLAFGGLGYAMGQFIQLLRILPCPAVATDLSYWGADVHPFAALTLLPTFLVNAIHHQGASELANDSMLEKAREEFAEFCLSRIGQRKGQQTKGIIVPRDTLVEPDPFWRTCYIQAAVSLRINPGRKGHERLFWAKQFDHDPMVREAATDAYPQLLRMPSLTAGSFPRRPLITAVWWLLQSHLLALGIEPNEERSQITLAALVRRTTEKLPTTNPPAN